MRNQPHSQPDDTIAFHEVAAIIKRHFLRSIIIMIFGTAVGIGLTSVVPKRFASKAVLNIQAAYFQIPLVGDLVSNPSDSLEYKAQRESLLRFALSDGFLEDVGTKFGLFRTDKEDRRHPAERESLLQGIEYFSLGGNSYQISAVGPSAEIAYELTRAVLNQMIATLAAERLGKLTRARTAILSNLETLKTEIAHAGPSQPASVDEASESLEEAQARLHSLEQRFTPQHPSVVEQRHKVELLRSRVSRGSKSGVSDTPLSASRRTIQDLHDDLAKKFNYLNIVIDMEKTTDNYAYLSVIEHPSIPSGPYAPKKRVFALGGLILGLVLSLLWAVVKELRRGTFVQPIHASEVLDAPFLGSLPRWEGESSQKLLTPPKQPSS